MAPVLSRVGRRIVLGVLGLSLAAFPGVVAAGPAKPGHLPIEATLAFDHAPRPGETVELTFDVVAKENAHGLAIELSILSPSSHPTEWLDGLTSEARVAEPAKPWKGDLAVGAHALLKEKVTLPDAGVYHVHGVVWGKGVSVGEAGHGEPLGFYDTLADLWLRVGADRTVMTNGESIAWTRQWNSSFSTAHGDDIPDAPVTLSLVFEKLPTPTTEGLLLVKLEARADVPTLALDLEMPATGLKVEKVETPKTEKPTEAVTVEPGGPVFDVRWKGALRKGEAATLRVPVRVVKTGWDVLRLYVSGTQAEGAPGFATHKEMIVVVDDVVSAARERVLEAPPKK